MLVFFKEKKKVVLLVMIGFLPLKKMKMKSLDWSEGTKNGAAVMLLLLALGWSLKILLKEGIYVCAHQFCNLQNEQELLSGAAQTAIVASSIAQCFILGKMLLSTKPILCNCAGNSCMITQCLCGNHNIVPERRSKSIGNGLKKGHHGMLSRFHWLGKVGASMQ
eukprot:Gb_30313 [translate_table: standard]